MIELGLNYNMGIRVMMYKQVENALLVMARGHNRCLPMGGNAGVV